MLAVSVFSSVLPLKLSEIFSLTFAMKMPYTHTHTHIKHFKGTIKCRSIDLVYATCIERIFDTIFFRFLFIFYCGHYFSTHTHKHTSFLRRMQPEILQYRQQMQWMILYFVHP
jgi:hypothetical protein